MTDTMQQLPNGKAHAAPPMNGRGPRFLTAMRRYLWLEHKVTDAAQKSYRPGMPGWDEFRFGRAATIDAQTLGESGEGLCSATLLSRTAITLLVRAHLAHLDISADITQTASENWALLLEQPDSARLKEVVTQQQIELITSILGAQGDQFLFHQPMAELRTTQSTLLNISQRLLLPLEDDARRIRRLIIWRWARLAIVLTIVVIGFSALWRILVKHPNLALNKSVSVQTSGAEWGRDPKALVDGNKTELGFHTIEGANQTATIDLGSIQSVSRVVVYNRVECCQERAVPLRIEVADDGKHYRKVAERNEPFGLTWTADFSSTKARYIRLTDLNSTYFHLTEVEVY